MTEDVIRAAYANFNTREIEPILALMCEDVNWENPMATDRIRGRDQLRKIWQLQLTSMHPVTEVQRVYTDPDGKTVVRVRFVVTEANGRFLNDLTTEHVLTLRDDLIARMDIRHPAEN